ncbi:MAG: DUF4160 domain-containing protein [Planctomycetes bacterium]|nr:DUF4160 domain-containing protein [Planctomycetota bacterium]
MYYQDHAPPHFHAIYGEHEATVRIDKADIFEGELPRRALKLVKEWAKLHQKELAENWDLARAAEKLKPVDPLE